MHNYDKSVSVGSTNLKSNWCGINFSVFTDHTTRRAIRMTSEWSYKNQNSRERGKFY